MGKLNIAHHKSYHPYRRDNIERVRRDEEEAALLEQKAEGRMLLADAEARIELLREKAKIGDKKKDKRKQEREDEKELERQLAGGRSTTMEDAVEKLPTVGGHINFFEDLEHGAISVAIQSAAKAKATAAAEAEKGVALAPSTKDMNPWYSDQKRRLDPGTSDLPEDKKKRDERRKAVHDPLTSITKQLAASSSPKSSRCRPPQRPASSSSSQLQDQTRDLTQARLSRESSERQRALALIEKRKRERAGNETPSTVYGGEGGYSDQFNREDVRAAR
ncbi:hypothetical protein DFP72DRAFT_792244, partial [Ephemerocybe angulata]